MGNDETSNGRFVALGSRASRGDKALGIFKTLVARGLPLMTVESPERLSPIRITSAQTIICSIQLSVMGA